MFADRHLTADKSDTGSKDNSHRNQCPENNLHRFKHDHRTDKIEFRCNIDNDLLIHKIQHTKRNRCSDQSDHNSFHNKRRTHKKIRCSDQLHNGNFFLTDRDTDHYGIADQKDSHTQQNQNNSSGNISQQFIKIRQCICHLGRLFYLAHPGKSLDIGYKGILHQPDPEKKPDLLHGLIAIRKMHMRAIEESGLTAADEMLYPETWRYLDDILSYVAIGARSVENQQHRMVASGMDVPVGMKNPTSGDFSVMLNSCIAAQSSHTFLYRGHEVTTDGNPLAHTILRGAVNKHGQNIPNYHYEDLERLHEKYSLLNLHNPACIVDANHSNSGKKHYEQPRIVDEVLHSRLVNPAIAELVKGVMVESYLLPGSQKVNEHEYGKSITDPCLGWEDSEKLLYEIAERC